MEKKIIQTENGPAPIGPYSQAVVLDQLVFVSGQTATDPLTGNAIRGDIKTEAARTMDNIKAILQAAGTDLNHVVKTTIYLVDMNNFSTVNEVYGTYFSEKFPARETVQVSRLPKDFNIEISVIAHL